MYIYIYIYIYIIYIYIYGPRDEVKTVMISCLAIAGNYDINSLNTYMNTTHTGWFKIIIIIITLTVYGPNKY